MTKNKKKQSTTCCTSRFTNLQLLQFNLADLQNILKSKNQSTFSYTSQITNFFNQSY